MNKDQLSKLHLHHVRFRPIANRTDHITGEKLESLDDRWLVSAVDKIRGLTVNLQRTGHGFTLPYDHIREFMEDAKFPGDGILTLKVQLELTGDKVNIEPLLDPTHGRNVTGV